MMHIFQSFCTRYDLVRRLFCRSLPLVYADHTLMPESLTKETVAVLPPSDYWALRVNLNVKTEKEAASYGPALFEHRSGYRYEAQKTGENSYLLIAYDPDEVSQKLLSLPNVALIKKITFSQWVFADMSQPIRLDNGKFLTTVEGIVIEIDGSYIKTETSVSLREALKNPRPYFKTIRAGGLATSDLTPKTAKTALLVLILLFGNLVAEGIMSYQESDRLEENIQKVLEKSQLPETSIEREAILNSLRNKEKEQRHFREQCKQISDIPIEIKNRLYPSVPIVTAPASVDGIVLIPGSKPGEANRLLVEEQSSSAAIGVKGDGVEELAYDGHMIHLVIKADDLSAREKLKSELRKRFRKVQLNERDNQLEARLQ